MYKISIVLPVYNAESRIKQCINSILSQTYENYELILIDDGSSDDSGRICDSYASTNSKIKVYHIENNGVSHARNYGIQMAHGDYIMFCDSDDTVDGLWCEHLLNGIINHPGSWVTCGCSYTDPKTNQKQKTVVLNERESITLIKKEEYYRVFSAGISGYVWNHIYDLSIIKEHDISFDESTDYAEDALFNVEYLKYCDRICFINEALYNYFVSPDSGLSHKYFADYYDKLKRIYLKRRELISDEYIPEFCYEYFYLFNQSLNNTFDKRNQQSFIQKLRYNQYVINDKTFKSCIDQMRIPEEDKKYISLLKKGNYLLVYLINK